VFLVNVPIGIVALVVVAKVLNVRTSARNHRIDWFGAVMLTVGVVPLLIVAEQGRDWGWALGARADLPTASAPADCCCSPSSNT